MRRLVRQSVRTAPVVALAAAGIAARAGPAAGQVPGGIPDTVAPRPGRPPAAASDSATRLLGPAADTLVAVRVSVAEPRSPEPSDVGEPTSRGMQLDFTVYTGKLDRGRVDELLVPLAECPIVVRLHRRADRADPPAWRSDRARGALACPPLERHPPAITTASWDVPGMLGDSLPAGRYALAYDLRLQDGRVLTYAAGGGYLTASLTPPVNAVGAVRFAAATRVEGEGPRRLVTTVWARNPTRRWLHLVHGGCATRVALYRDRARRGRPVWRSERQLSFGTGGRTAKRACRATTYEVSLPPGDSAALGEATPLGEVLSDSVRPGRYYATAVLQLLDGEGPTALRPRDVPLDAGAVDLRLAPDPLPSVRLVDDLRVDAATRLVRGTGGADTVRTLVRVTNTAAVSRALDVARDCPVAVFAYRSAARRDAWPPETPDWQPERRCAPDRHPFTLAPGASWVFAYDAPVDASLREAARPGGTGSGRLWFTALLTGTRPANLAAGDVTVP